MIYRRKRYLLNLEIVNDYKITEEYRFKYEKQCSCSYCRNYYKTFKEKYPQTSKFLKKLGLDPDYPLEIMLSLYDEPENQMDYLSFYPAKGSMGEDEISVSIEGLEIKVFKGSSKEIPCPKPQMEEPYLLVGISGVILPWILDEDPE